MVIYRIILKTWEHEYVWDTKKLPEEEEKVKIYIENFVIMTKPALYNLLVRQSAYRTMNETPVPVSG